MRGFVVVSGDDDLLVRREVERVVAEAEEQDPELTVDRREASELEHLPDLRTGSLFGGRTLLVLRAEGGVAKGLATELLEFAADPAPDAGVVLGAIGGRVAPLTKAAGDDHVDARTPPPWADERWDRLVGDEFRRRGLHADADAIAALRRHAGNDPAAIATQVATVAATVDGREVHEDDVDGVVFGHGRRSGFDLADVVADRDAPGALAVLQGLLSAGDAPTMVLGALTYRFRQLLAARSGGGPSSVPGRVSQGQYRRLSTIARDRFAPGELAWCHDRLAQLDVELKGSDLPGPLLLEVAVVELCTPRTPPDPLRPTHPAWALPPTGREPRP